tara:strand:+ start:2115 stop:2303 length:189 start_codon:yes stop_codon:yes gene_type:complete
MFKDKDDAEAWAKDLLKKYGIPNPEAIKKDNEDSIISVDSFNNKSQKHRNITFLDEDDGYHD